MKILRLIFTTALMIQVFPANAQSPAELPESAIFTYKVERDTLLKPDTADSSERADESCRLSAGTKINTLGPAYLAGRNHYQLNIHSMEGGDCPALPRGYVFGPHIGLTHPTDVRIVMQKDVWLKSRIDDPEALSSSQKCYLKAGTVLRLQGRAQLFPKDHYLIRINPKAMNPCPFMADGYLRGDDFGMSRPDGMEYKAQRGTWLKLRVADEAALSAAEKCFVPTDAALIVAEPLQSAIGNYALVNLRSSSFCSFRSAYVYAPHFGVDFSKTPANPGSDQNPSPSWAGAFVKYYSDNYRAIASRVGFTTNACAAFASTALAAYGIKVPYIEWATTVGEHLAYLGWPLIKSHQQLAIGDVVFTRDAQSAVDGQATHVWIFAGWAQPNVTAYALDNQGSMYKRYINNSSYHDVFWYAYCPP